MLSHRAKEWCQCHHWYQGHKATLKALYASTWTCAAVGRQHVSWLQFYFPFSANRITGCSSNPRQCRVYLKSASYHVSCSVLTTYNYNSPLAVVMPNTDTNTNLNCTVANKKQDVIRAGLKLWGAFGRYPIPAGTIPVYIRGWEKLVIFDGNRRLSLKRCEVGQVTIQNIFFTFRETDYSYAYTFL